MVWLAELSFLHNIYLQNRDGGTSEYLRNGTIPCSPGSASPAYGGDKAGCGVINDKHSSQAWMWLHSSRSITLISWLFTDEHQLIVYKSGESSKAGCIYRCDGERVWMRSIILKFTVSLQDWTFPNSGLW